LTTSREPESFPDKRGNAREPTRQSVRMILPATEIMGLTRDVSNSGAFVISASDLPIELEIADDEARRRGRIVRLELLPGGGVGMAIDFDGTTSPD